MSSDSRQIFVTKLPRDTSSDDLRDLFKKFGSIRDVIMKKSYGFVKFSDE